MLRVAHYRLAFYSLVAIGLGALIFYYVSTPLPITSYRQTGPDSNHKILCWLLTHEKHLNSKGVAVRDTWTQRCDKVIFFSTRSNRTFPTIGLNIPEGRKYLTRKSIKAFMYCYKEYGRQFDWFLKADDDTYVIMENLRRLLQPLDPNESLYVGHRFNKFTPQGYMSGGASYVLSREALEQFAMRGIVGRRCSPRHAAEDVYIGVCLSKIGVKAINSLDEDGLETFHPMNFFSYFDMAHTLPEWVHNYSYHPVKKGFDCCSNHSISFHYIRPHEMYMLDFLIYHLRRWQ